MSNKIILKGLFTEFDRIRNNGRIYPESLYLKHIKNHIRKSKIKNIYV